MKKHDHRQSTWILGTSWLWCYRCGAIRPNKPGRSKWEKPTGLTGSNPAMAQNTKEDKTDGYPQCDDEDSFE